MMPRWLISGTGPRVGKTMIGCALAFAGRVRALRVGVMKPVQTGAVGYDGFAHPSDGQALLAAAGIELPLELVSPYSYRAALAPLRAAGADAVASPDFAFIERAYRSIEQLSDLMIVEDTVTLSAALDDRLFDYADFALAVGLELILVANNRPGFIEAAGQVLDYAKQRQVVIRGTILNGIDRAMSASVQDDADRLAQATGVPCLGTVRYREPVRLTLIEQLLPRAE